MVLYSFPYLVVSFTLSAWIGQPHNYWIELILHFSFQGIYYAAGGVVDDNVLFWGWQALVSFLGIVAGTMILPKRSTLFSKHWIPWVHFILSLAVVVGTMFLYSAFPPLSTVPAGEASLGVIISGVANFAVVLMIWYGFIRRNRFFERWLVSITLLHLFAFIAISGLAEVWVALISGGGTILISAFTLWVESMKIKLKRKKRGILL